MLLELFTYWSVRVRCAVRFRPAPELAAATHVRVHPHAFCGTKEVVPLRMKTVVGGALPSGLILWLSGFAVVRMGMCSGGSAQARRGR